MHNALENTKKMHFKPEIWRDLRMFTTSRILYYESVNIVITLLYELKK